MSPQLRVVVTGARKSGKSSLINAIVGQEVLPTSPHSETAVITYVVPQQVEDDVEPTLHAYRYDDQGHLRWTKVAEREGDVREYIQRLNRAARAHAAARLGAAGGAVGAAAGGAGAGAGDELEAVRPEECRECRVSAQLRDSLNVFVPPAAEWCDTQLMDIGGQDDALDPIARAYVDLAYALSHQLVICVRHDQTQADSTGDLIREVAAKVPYHFDDALNGGMCPLLFVITQVDKADCEHEELVQRLRATLHLAIEDCPELVHRVPIVCISAERALRGLRAGGAQADGASAGPVDDWERFESLLTSFAGCKREIVRAVESRRATHIAALFDSFAAPLAGEWPLHASTLWEDRKALAMKVGLGSALVAGTAGTAVAVGVYMSSAAAAGAAAAQAATATAEAGAAAAAANSWWAWLGFGSYGAAAAAAATSAATSQSAAAAAAATASCWGFGSTMAGVSAGAAMGAVAWSSPSGADDLRPLPDGIIGVAGMLVAHCSAVGARDVRMALRELRFNAAASSIKAGEKYQDALFYPDGVVPRATLESVCALGFPFLLLNAKHRKCLYADGEGQVSCDSSVRAESLWWAVPAAGATVDGRPRLSLQNAVSFANLRTEPPGRFAGLVDKRLAVRCTEDAAPEEWEVLPGSEEGTLRFRSVPTSQSLFFDGFFVGCYDHEFPDQDWLVVPKAPLYIGEFVQDSMCGRGQCFWPNGSPLFKGEVRDGKLSEGFAFDRRSICHGYFRFSGEGEGALEVGDSPSHVAGAGRCARCTEQECMSRRGKALKPCGHAVLCEACAQEAVECPLCRAPVEGVMRANS